MRRNMVRYGFLAVCLGVLSGCYTHRVVMSHNQVVVQEVKRGDTLEWRGTAGSTEFTVVFPVESPCKNGETSLLSVSGVARCKVGKLPKGSEYPYTIQPKKKEKDSSGPRTCGGCVVGGDPGSDGSDIEQKAKAVQDTTTVDGDAQIVCLAGQPASLYWLAEPTTGVFFHRNLNPWTITFTSPASQVCNESTTTPSVVNQNQPFCTFHDPKITSYTVTIHPTEANAKCTDGTVTFPPYPPITSTPK